ncbi:MAG: hypothetical protein JXL84_20960, partial [Deltaproteobacteria bacterium]|nr:hypothetical protein [Deltaproteobacteria bacterium]
MSEFVERMEKNIEEIALELVTLDKGDIPAMGNIMNALCRLEEDAGGAGEPSFLALVSALKSYMEKVILAERDDLCPLEEGTGMLQTLYRYLRNGEPVKEDISPMLERLGFRGTGSERTEEPASGDGEKE